MKNPENIHLNDQLNLSSLFVVLWRGKFFVVLCIAIAISCGSFYLRGAQRTYTVEFSLKPVAHEQEGGSSLSGLGGLAKLAGVKIPGGTKSSNDYIIYQQLLDSVEISEVAFENKDLVKSLFSSEWNEELGDFSEIKKSKNVEILGNVFRIITGSDKKPYMAPNPLRLAEFIGRKIQINEDKITGFLVIKSQTSIPHKMIILIDGITQATDDLLRSRYINFSKEPLAYYKNKLQSARSREHKEALAKLISREEQKLMLALSSKYFVAEPFIEPKISMYPTSPRPMLILVLSVILGFIFSSTILVSKYFIKKGN